MARPRKTTRSIEKNICFDEPLVNRVDLVLYSPLEGKVPFGAWKKFLQSAVEDKLAKMLKEQKVKKSKGESI